jgi:hypothetical protein
MAPSWADAAGRAAGCRYGLILLGRSEPPPEPGHLNCPWGSSALAPAGSVPRCRRTQVLFPASVLLRRADGVAVIGAALLAKAGRAGTGGSPCWWAAGLGGAGLVTPDHGGSPTRCWRVITKLADRSAAQRRGEMGCR